VKNVAFMVVDGEELSPNKHFIEDVKKILAEKPNMKFVTMCRSGKRSRAAAEALEAAGIPVSNMLEGFEGGKDANGYRTVNGWKNSYLPYVAACDGNGYDRYKFVLTPSGNMVPSQAVK
jgi:rhodanese-related sulfurtransferase